MQNSIFRATSGIASLGFLGYLYVSHGKTRELDNKENQNEANTNLVPKQHKSIPTPTDSIQKIQALMLEKGVPGLTISVSRKGNIIWQAAFGYCDVENLVPCDPMAAMRIGSVSKSIFAATMVAPLIETNQISLEDSIHKYLTLDELPKLKFNGTEYDITVGQLLSHRSGIRHYDDNYEDVTLKPICSKGSHRLYQTINQFEREGFYQRETYRSVIEALEPFKNDPLVNEPGKQFTYTTYGYTLLSAVIEKVIQKYEGLDSKKNSDQIEDIWIGRLHRDWRMKNTHLDQDEVLISRRARYYRRQSLDGALTNAPYQDNSVKWAGGGLVSTTPDMLKFANLLIDSYKARDGSKLKPETVKLLWTEVGNSYCLGFELAKNADKMSVYHTGLAMGASSVLLIQPDAEIAVAILANFYPVNLLPLSLEVAKEFDRL